MRFLISFAAAAALSGLAVVGAQAQREPARGSVAGKAAAEYDRLLAGKTPGKPETCIDTRFNNPRLTAYDGKLIYRVSSKLVYVTDTGGGCSNVARGDTLVTRQFQGRLCRGDIAQTVNLPIGMPTGSCAMGDFIPYRSK